MKKSLLHILISFGIVTVGFLSVNCGGDDGSGKGPDVPLTGIALNQTALLMEVGEQATLQPIFTPSNATNKQVEWFSDSSSAIVEHGVVTALALGVANISVVADDGDYKAYCKVEVVADKDAVLVESIEFGQQSYAMKVGDVLSLVPTILPENADNKELKWETEDTHIISLADNGVVEALAIGNAVVTASATDGSGVEANVTINVSNPITEVNFCGSDDYAFFTTWHGNVFELDVRTTPANADLRTLDWAFLTLNGQPEPKNIAYSVEQNKVMVWCAFSDENSTRDGCKIRVNNDDESDYAYAQVDFLTYPWIMASKNNGATFDYAAAVLCESSNWKFNYERVDYLSSQLYFVAYCPKSEEYLAEHSPLSYYPDDIIPTSAYTLTSSDPEKLALEKLEGKGYRLKMLTEEIAAVTLTYTCGDYVQKYTINVIP